MAEIEKTYGLSICLFCTVSLFSALAVFPGGYPDKFVELAAEMFGIVVTAHLCDFRNVM